MKKKLLLGLAAVLIISGGVSALSAWEAHVINVTAHIENALKVLPLTGKLTFGTVFPQEYLEKTIWITTSESFCKPDQTRVLNIDYKIVQKPKPIWEQTKECYLSAGEIWFADIHEAREYCHDDPEDLDCCYPSLCPYLSKTPVDDDPEPFDDHGVPAFHDPSDPLSIADGTIHKYDDLMDTWIIDLDVPCFYGYCAQDWTHYGWELPYELESETFGCDLWVEVTDIY